MSPVFVVLISLFVLITLLRKNLLYGIEWVILTLPLYELGRVSFGPIPTTVVELNILVLFGWWAISQITYHASHITDNPETRKQENKKTNVIPYVDTESKQKKQKSKDLKSFLFSFRFWVPAFAGMTKRVLGKWYWLVIAWLAIATFSMAISPNLREAAGVWKAFFIEPIMFLAVFIHGIKKEYILRILNALIASGVIVAIIGIFQKITGLWIENPFWSAEATRRVTSVFPFPNAVGLYLAPIAIIALTLAVSKLPRWGVYDIRIAIQKTPPSLIVYLLSFLFMLSAILFARSRGALLGVAVGVVSLGLIHAGKRTLYWFGIGIATMILVASGMFTQLKTFIVNQPTSFSGGDSRTIRAELWKESLSLLNDHPVTGSRMAGFPKAVAPYHHNPNVEIYKYPHNVLLNFWTELGLLGLIVFLIVITVFYTTLVHSLRTRIATHDEWLENIKPIRCSLPAIHYSLLAAMTALLVHGLVDVPYFKNDLSVLFWILIGISIIITNERKSNLVIK